MVEMLMVMGIMGILIVILSQVFSSILTMKLRSEATSAVAQDSRYILSRLSYDVARASAITAPSTGSGGSTLTLTIAGVSYTYALSGTTLTLSVGGAQPVAMSSVGTKITALNFVHLDQGNKKSVTITITIAPTNAQPGGVTLARQLTTTVATR